jgi:hypothetical protein
MQISGLLNSDPLPGINVSGPDTKVCIVHLDYNCKTATAKLNFDHPENYINGTKFGIVCVHPQFSINQIEMLSYLCISKTEILGDFL